MIDMCGERESYIIDERVYCVPQHKFYGFRHCYLRMQGSCAHQILALGMGRGSFCIMLWLIISKCCLNVEWWMLFEYICWNALWEPHFPEFQLVLQQCPSPSSKFFSINFSYTDHKKKKKVFFTLHSYKPWTKPFRTQETLIWSKK